MFDFNFQLFAAYELGTTVGGPTASPVNRTSDSALSDTMKTFYSKSLLENAREEMVFTQFGKKTAMHGNTIEFRKWNTFAKALTPLTEGVIPVGHAFGMSKITGTITQHGDYTTVSDRLEYEAFDDVIYGATEEMGAAEGETFDTLTRNIVIGGTSKAYAGGKTARNALTNTDILNPEMVAKAVTQLKKMKAPKIDGYYVCILHPSVAFDLRNSSEWKSFHQYDDVAPIFNGEIGTLHGCRFIESNQAKVHEGAGASGVATYDCLFLGKDAFAVLDPEGEGMEMIVKDKSQIGGPLNQFSTIGYKFCHGAKILYEERMLRVECGSSFGSVDKEN